MTLKHVKLFFAFREHRPSHTADVNPVVLLLGLLIAHDFSIAHLAEVGDARADSVIVTRTDTDAVDVSPVHGAAVHGGVQFGAVYAGIREVALPREFFLLLWRHAVRAERPAWTKVC